MKINYRPEINGLRAIAVIFVILYHAEFSFFNETFFKGGFIGVDIFFVISGYLITAIILKELNLTKNFSYLNFYERRARRLLPALFFVMLISFPLAWTYLEPNALLDYSKSIIYSSIFSSNFYFYLTGLEYGTADGLLKPFLHTWSLAIEEQFYIFYPIFLIIIIRYFKKYLLHILLVLLLTSLFFNNFFLKFNSSISFYFLHTRMWEILAGSVIAQIEINNERRIKNNTISNLGILSGLILIIFYLILFSKYNKHIIHPSLFTALPVIGSCLILWFSKKESIFTKILSSKPFVGIGLISYSLYLWHYPIFAIARSKDGTPSNFDKFEWIALTFLLSLISYFFVEKIFKNHFIFSRKRLFFSLFFGISLILIINAYVIYKDGFKSKLQVTKNYSLDNEFYRKEWLDYSKNNNMPLFTKIDNKKILIIGNSHGRDTFNMFYLNKKLYKNFDFSIVNVHINCFFHFLKKDNELPTYCNQAFRNIDKSLAKKLINQSKLIILSTQWSEEDIENLNLLIQILKDRKKEIIILNNALEVNTKIRRGYNLLDFFVLKNQRLPTKEELMKIEKQKFKQLKNTKQIDKKLEKIANESNVLFFSKEDYLCDKIEKSCKVLTDKDKKISWDYAHYTLEGAEYLGKRLFKLEWLKY